MTPDHRRKKVSQGNPPTQSLWFKVHVPGTHRQLLGATVVVERCITVHDAQAGIKGVFSAARKGVGRLLGVRL